LVRGLGGQAMKKFDLTTKITQGPIERARHALPLQLRALRVLRGEWFFSNLVESLPR